MLSERVERIGPSPIFAMTMKALALKKAGQDIIDLAVGEPDFDTPDSIKAAAIDAIQKGFTKYTTIGGILGLKQAITEKLLASNQLSYEVEQILVSAGAKQSLFNAFQALLRPGDEVIIPAPYWTSYPDMVLLAEGKPVKLFAGIEQQFKITPEQLEQAITPKTRLVILNSPSNPTGAVYTLEELSALGAVLLKYPDVFIITDDIYESIYWGQSPFCNLLNACAALMPRTLVVNGVSKTYAMTGWRIGYAAGPKELIQAMTNVQSQSTSNPCSISQVAAQEAIAGDQKPVSLMVAAFKERHDFVIQALNALTGVECLSAKGAFYAFPKVEGLIQHLKLANDLELADYLLTKAQVAVVPGTAFGAPGYLRLSFATSLENLKVALKRIEAVLRA